MKKSRFFLMIPLGAALLSLGACDSIVYSHSSVTPTHPELYQDRFKAEFKTGSLTDGQIAALGQDYAMNGNGPFSIKVTYDPKSRVNTAKKAVEAEDHVVSVLKAKGVNNIDASTTPLEGSGSVSHTLVAYSTLNARASSACPESLNMKFTENDYDPNYKLGCTIQAYMAKQIAHPSDLTGNGVMDKASGRRDANLLETYQAGQPNQELKGDNASQVSAGK